MDQLEKTLQKYFGYSSFRPLQKEIISDILNRHDVLALMPTGSGKSLCFQIPSIIAKNKLTIVISPLIALMKDQIDHLNQFNIPAAFLNSSQSSTQQREITNSLTNNNKYKLLYIAPE